MKPAMKVFKMRNINLNNPLQGERAELHYRIIEEFTLLGFCVAMPLKPLEIVYQELGIHKKYRKPFYMAWLQLISIRAFYTKGNWKQNLDLIFDEQVGSKLVLEAWDILMAKHKGDTAPFRNKPIFRRDDDFLPLQAADLLAWWARKNWISYGTFNNQKRLFPWEERTGGPDYMFTEMNEAGIRAHMLANASPSISS